MSCALYFNLAAYVCNKIFCCHLKLLMRLPLINVKNVHLSRSGNKMHNKTKNKVGDQLRLSTKSTKIEKGLIECQL